LSKGAIKAVSLISSGLDSLLASVIVKRFGIEVVGLHCYFQFDPTLKENPLKRLRALFGSHGIPVIIKDTTHDFLKRFLNPHYGYGSEMNPCIDCRLLMLQYGKTYMEEIGAQFLITGEVVGQRPMTQNKPTIFHIDKVSGLRGLILRPLSAKILPSTIPEQKNWVNREYLYGFSGRSRKNQIALASELGIADYSQPAGGCLLTDPQWSKRMKKLMDCRSRDEISVENIQLLRLGRHFWPNNHLWVIVGRHEADNQLLELYTKDKWIFRTVDVEGPLAIADDVKDKNEWEIVAGIVARYCSKCGTDNVSVSYEGKTKGICLVAKTTDSVLKTWRV
jgi:tRNA-specific 2-thiouridylase